MIENRQKWEEEFDKLDMSGIGLLIKNEDDNKLAKHSLLIIKSFISKTLQDAITVEREMFLKFIEDEENLPSNSNTPKHTLMNLRTRLLSLIPKTE